MKKYFILFTSFLGLSFSAIAQEIPYKEQEKYGVIDAVYPNEQRIIIDDMSINYNAVSKLKDKGANTILNISKPKYLGQYIKYSTSPTSSSSLFLIKLQIISVDKFNESQEVGDEY